MSANFNKYTEKEQDEHKLAEHEPGCGVWMMGLPARNGALHGGHGGAHGDM